MTRRPRPAARRREGAVSSEKIRTLNDAFRTTGSGGQIFISPRVAQLSRNEHALVIAKVRGFNSFAEDDSAHGDHDFGSFEVVGLKFFWKIDLHEDPEVKRADGQPATTRALTIMLAEEW
jgi:hypothetical protein